MVTDLDEVFARPLSPEDFQRLRSAWKIPNDVPDKHIMKYINSQKSKGKRIGEDEVDTELNEIEDIQRRAGISQNWNRDTVLRALQRIDNDFVAILDEFYGMEDEAQRRELIRLMEESGKPLSVVRRTINKVR